MRSQWPRRTLWPLGLGAGVAVLGRTVAPDGVGAVDVLFVLGLLVGWSFIASGLVGWARRPENPVGALMVVIGFLWFAPMLLRSSSEPAVATAGVVVLNFWVIAFVLLLVAFPSGRVGSRLDRVLLAAVAVPGGPMQVLWLLFLPLPGNALLVWPDAALANAVDGVQRIMAIAALSVLSAVLVRRWVHASRPLRRVLHPVLAGAAAVVLFALVILLDKLGGRTDLLDAGFRVVFAAVPVVFLGGVLHARLARSAIGDLLVELPAAGAHAALRDALARAVRDPSLAVAYWVPEYGGYVDVDGRAVELAAEADGRVATLVERDGVRVAALIHDASLRDEPELVGAVCAAAGIALENERLQADLRARLEELKGSRSRIVEAGDAARRRLERDLHDGAQQRLVSMSIALRLVASRLEPDSEEERLLSASRTELAASLAELRQLASGLHPAVLSDYGLSVALEALAARAPLPVRLVVKLDARPPAPVEVAAYYLVAEGLTNVAKYACASAATVDVARVNGRLVVEVADDGVGGADPGGGSGLRGLADRVEALDGRLRVSSPPAGGTTIRAELPCA
jgi:signal transduction histidine kinase